MLCSLRYVTTPRRRAATTGTTTVRRRRTAPPQAYGYTDRPTRHGMTVVGWNALKPFVHSTKVDTVCKFVEKLAPFGRTRVGGWAVDKIIVDKTWLFRHLGPWLVKPRNRVLLEWCSAPRLMNNYGGNMPSQTSHLQGDRDGKEVIVCEALEFRFHLIN